MYMCRKKLNVPYTSITRRRSNSLVSLRLLRLVTFSGLAISEMLFAMQSGASSVSCSRQPKEDSLYKGEHADVLHFQTPSRVWGTHEFPYPPYSFLSVSSELCAFRSVASLSTGAH